MGAPCIASTPGLTGYKIDRCRCVTCTAANRDWQANRGRQIAYGRWDPFTAAEPVRVHVRVLMAQGMGWKSVAAKAGVSSATISRLLYGRKSNPPSQRIRHNLAASILAVRFDPMSASDNATIDGTGTRRRTQALVAIGWSIADQARRLGRGPRNHAYLVESGDAQVTAGLARTVARLYDELSATPAADSRVARRSRNWAAKQGWVPPLAWDDDTIDDPLAQPNLGGLGDDLVDEVAVRRAIASTLPYRQLRPAERIEAYRLLVATGATPAVIRRILHINQTVFAALAQQATADRIEVAA